MLTHDEKYVLKIIIKLSKDKMRLNSRDDLLSKVSNKLSFEELNIILDSLYQKGFFKDYKIFERRGPSFTVTHETQKYNEVTVKNAIKFLFCSVIVPIIVSVITAYITARITVCG